MEIVHGRDGHDHASPSIHLPSLRVLYRAAHHKIQRAGMLCTRHQVSLATLIVAAKYLNDSSPKNKHWAAYAFLFDPSETFQFDEDEALKHLALFIANRQSDPVKKQGLLPSKGSRLPRLA
ncbi:hypothetical protein JVU11DRAFT_10048 [Chiua virens]|nr:hypothetical protein JVU11DRAFT_10048 [Chiua virens]